MKRNWIAIYAAMLLAAPLVGLACVFTLGARATLAVGSVAASAYLVFVIAYIIPKNFTDEWK
jgi:hypothetical protein